MDESKPIESPADDSVAVLSPAEVRDLKLESSSNPSSSNRTNYIDRIQDAALDRLVAATDVKSLLLRTRDRKMREFLRLLADPRHRKKPLARLARMAGVDYMDMVELIRDDAMNRGTMQIMTSWPEIATDVVKDSRSITGNCPDCGGSKRLASESAKGKRSWRKCHRCNGTGAVNLPGNAEARKLAAQAIGVIKSGSGPSINIHNNNLNMASHAGPECVIDALEKLDNSPAGAIIDADFEDIGEGRDGQTSFEGLDGLGDIPLD